MENAYQWALDNMDDGGFPPISELQNMFDLTEEEADILAEKLQAVRAGLLDF